MGRRQQSITLSLSEQDKASLEVLAQEMGILWGTRPNISKLIEAIARHKLLVARNNDWPKTRIHALEQATKVLFDTGQTEEAKVIAQLLLERNELPIPLRLEIERRFTGPITPWREAIDRYIKQHQPFRLYYQDAAERSWEFTIRHARITFREKRLYLDVWCEETEGNQDIPELVHNWCLRLDRLTGVDVVPTGGAWHDDLDYVEIELQLLNGLAFAYQAKPEDLFDERLDRQGRIIRRRVSQTFWLLREVLAYGPDCVIVKPDTVRKRLLAQLEQALKRYNSL